MPVSQSTAHQPTLRMTRVVSRHRGFTPSCRVSRYALSRFALGRGCARYKGKGCPYSIAERRVPELIPVLDSKLAGDVSQKPGGRLPLLSTRQTCSKPLQPLRGLLPISLLGEHRHDGCEQFA